jgi:hypothetical protein
MQQEIPFSFSHVKRPLAANMAKQKQPPGPAMTLGNMRQLGVHRLVDAVVGGEDVHS